MALADIVAKSPDGETVLIVEAKNKRGTSSAWAAQMRRNVQAHFDKSAPFFLLATPDHFYFWFNRATDPNPVPPDLRLGSRALLEPYLNVSKVGKDNLSESGFELIVEAWLRELTHASQRDERNYPRELVESGFLKALHGVHLS